MRNHWSTRLWKQALIFAIAFHLAILGGFVFGPHFFNEEKKRPVPYTVRLFEPSMAKKADSLAAPHKSKKISSQKAKSHILPKKKEPPVKLEKKTPKPKPKPVAEKKQISKKAVSLNPQKAKKVAKKKKEKEKKKRQASNSKKQKNKETQERKVAQRIKQIQNRLKKKREEEYLKKRLQELAKRQNKQDKSSGGTAEGGTGRQNQQAMVYGNFIKAKIWRNWHFPKALADRKDLEAVVTITITKDGRILDMRVKKYSGYSVFDRSVLKAIRESDPLPPLPPSLGQGPEEIDIRFDLSKAGLTG